MSENDQIRNDRRGSTTLTYENAKVHFRPTNPEDPDDDGYATVYDEVELLPNGWLACGTDSTYGPQLFPPHRIDELDAGYQP